LEKLHYKVTPEQESSFEVVQRTLPILKNIAKKHLGTDILIVTHGGVIKALLIYLAEHDWESTYIQNGQRITFLFEKGRFHLLEDFTI